MLGRTMLPIKKAGDPKQNIEVPQKQASLLLTNCLTERHTGFYC